MKISISVYHCSSYQIDLRPSKYVPPTRKHKLQLISKIVYPLNWSWWRRIIWNQCGFENTCMKTNCVLWISKLNGGCTKSFTFTYNSVSEIYRRLHMAPIWDSKFCMRTDGFLWLLKIIQTTYLKKYNTSLFTIEMTGAFAKRNISSYKEHILEHF